MATAVVIDTDSTTSAVIRQLLGPQHRIISYHRGALATEFVREKTPDVVFLSMSLPDVDSMDLLEILSLQVTGPPVVAMMEDSPPRRVADAVRHGASGVVTHPLRAEDLSASFLQALADRARALPKATAIPIPEIVGMSGPIVRLRQLIQRIAGTEATVLIDGASGVGKELVARAVHNLSSRCERAFEARNCGAIPEALFESELFGTERGAFTGAVRRPGAFEMAHRGSLFLDELGELSPSSQVKLLRVLETQRFYRVGGTNEVATDVRIIAATNRRLREQMERGEFREDLYYRINVVRLEVPPLRSRTEDIPLLVDHFHRTFVRAGGHASVQCFAPDALDAMCAYEWPGNVRELKNVVLRALLMSNEGTVRARDIQFG